MRLFISVVLFTLLGTLSASPLRLATRDDRGLAIAVCVCNAMMTSILMIPLQKRAPGSPANENAAPATGSNEKPVCNNLSLFIYFILFQPFDKIEDSLEKNRRNWRKLNYFNDDVYEVVDFGNPPQTALVKVFRGSYSDFQKDQVQQLAKLGVLLKEAYNPFTSTYYIAIKKVGKFASEFDPKEKPDTAHLIRKAQETCDIKLQTQ